MSRRCRKRTEEPFQMAPMIDMVFLLLVFFMTVSTLARESRPELELATSITAAVPEEAPPREVITVLPGKAGYRWYWHNREVSDPELGKLLLRFVESGESGELLLRGSPELPYEAWERVLRLIREAGVTEIVFATFEA
ncbi:MAG TPA: biopolymer transporter ExbD [Oceanipulchritudo sp.]|nr:biopolymer transporter ExbD [Oceanipulchritudo sp.]